MEATPRTNRSAKGGARSSLHYGGEGVLIHPPHQGVCGRHGTEDLSVVESRCGAVAVGQTYLLPPLSFGGASLVRPWLCFHIPLIEPDMQISRIRLSDKTSRLRPRLAAPSRGQTYETVMPVKVREWIRPAPASPDLVLEAQPSAQPHRCVVVERPIRFGDRKSTRLNSSHL